VPAHAPCRILVVDDNHDAADTLALFLKMHHYDVRQAYLPDEALRVADDFRPDVVLMDINLPEKSGYQLADEMKGRVPGCKVVAVTGQSAPDYVERSRRHGFRYHLVKPVDPLALEHIVHEECAE
jgi:DNA-binding response OmpR family regulator